MSDPMRFPMILSNEPNMDAALVRRTAVGEFLEWHALRINSDAGNAGFVRDCVCQLLIIARKLQHPEGIAP